MSLQSCIYGYSSNNTVLCFCSLRLEYSTNESFMNSTASCHNIPLSSLSNIPHPTSHVPRRTSGSVPLIDSSMDPHIDRDELEEFGLLFVLEEPIVKLDNGQQANAILIVRTTASRQPGLLLTVCISYLYVLSRWIPLDTKRRRVWTTNRCLSCFVTAVRSAIGSAWIHAMWNLQGRRRNDLWSTFSSLTRR